MKGEINFREMKADFNMTELEVVLAAFLLGLGISLGAIIGWF